MQAITTSLPDHQSAPSQLRVTGGQLLERKHPEMAELFMTIADQVYARYTR